MKEVVNKIFLLFVAMLFIFSFSYVLSLANFNDYFLVNHFRSAIEFLNKLISTNPSLVFLVLMFVSISIPFLVLNRKSSIYKV